jgi:hypothetical protein
MLACSLPETLGKAATLKKSFETHLVFDLFPLDSRLWRYGGGRQIPYHWTVCSTAWHGIPARSMPESFCGDS